MVDPSTNHSSVRTVTSDAASAASSAVEATMDSIHPDRDPDPSTTTTTEPEPKPKQLSKNQLKKQKRWERLSKLKTQKKQQAKEARHAKARAQGRDLEEERRIQLLNEESGIGRKRREQKCQERTDAAQCRFGVCIDCAFEERMTPKELNSLAQQIRYAYAFNRKAYENMVCLSVAGLNVGDYTYEVLARVAGFPKEWGKNAFSMCDDLGGVEDVTHAVNHEDVGTNTKETTTETNEPITEPNVTKAQRPTNKFVYLTNDSPNTLSTLDDSKTYIIGGMVDRNRLQRAAISRAEALGIPHAKLPIDEHLKLCATKVLTVNHVFEILVQYNKSRDWKKALLEVLPQRKEATDVQGANDAGLPGTTDSATNGTVPEEAKEIESRDLTKKRTDADPLIVDDASKRAKLE